MSGIVFCECRKQHCLLFGFFVGSAVMIVGENTVFSSSQNIQRVPSIHDRDILSWNAGSIREESIVQTYF